MTKKSSEEYWADYYKSGAAPEVPSLFAQYVMDRFAEGGQSLIELGCGNGRDARFFASNGVGVLAVDQCIPEIDELTRTENQQNGLHYEAADFTRLPDADRPYDLIYSRFTLHSVDAEGQKRTLEWCQRNLAMAGRLCIETRGQLNELYKKGEPVAGEQDAYIYNDHYRRFVDFEAFQDEISETGLKITEASEQTGYAPFEDTDYHFIRIIAQK